MMPQKQPLNEQNVMSLSNWMTKESPCYLPRQFRFWFRRLFGLFIAAMLILCVIQGDNLESTFAAILITIMALLPPYLWGIGKSKGFPIFPMVALPFLWTFAAPFMIEHPIVASYPPEDHLIAGLKVSGFLALATVIWFALTSSKTKPPSKYYALPQKKGGGWLFYLILFVSIVLEIAWSGGWLPVNYFRYFNLIRRVLAGLNLLGLFVLSNQFGEQKMTRTKSLLFLVLIASYLLVTPLGLLLIVPLTAALIAILGFTMGRKKVPWAPLIIIFSFFIFLHYGKAEMRGKYWEGGNRHYIVQPWKYAKWYGEWVEYAIDYFKTQKGSTISTERKQSFVERSSLMHIFLEVQAVTPHDVPYLQGETYKFIPQLFVPRILNPKKPISHEGTTLLNIHFGRQTREQSHKTTIGWGLLNESYANFGYKGCLLLAIIFGLFFGLVTRWSTYTPLLSFRSLFSIVLINVAFQTEWSAGVFIATVWQALVSLLMITIIFMKVHRAKRPSANLTRMRNS